MAGYGFLAHPAVYPTGESARRPLAVEERRLFDLVVRRFISCFGEDAIREASSVDISVGGHEFRIGETKVLVPGWMKPMMGWRETDDVPMRTSALREGDTVAVEAVTIEEHLRLHSARYNQATLLEKMEKEGNRHKGDPRRHHLHALGQGVRCGRDLDSDRVGIRLGRDDARALPSDNLNRLDSRHRWPTLKKSKAQASSAGNSSMGCCLRC